MTKLTDAIRKDERTKTLDEVEKIIDSIKNPYPSDLVLNPEKPETQEGKFWMFGQKVWENFRQDIKEELSTLRGE